MKKIVFLFLISVSVFAQTGIGTTTPNASAKLDVYSTNKGFLPPRVTLTSTTDASTIASPAEGLLVYNLGSVGLQAGYYFWNGANWATIATATSAGNGVTASDMVKIYDGVGNAATINANGATFSVTTSGKYSFDISTSATCGNCMVTINFQVRDGGNGNAVIGSDYQTSWSNNVHAEYNGRIEVNLLAGRSYNVLVTASSGSINNNDYTRVYMKQVSGNLPVTGQSVDYGMARYSGADGSTIADNALVPFDATASGNIPWSGNKFTLKANKTYELESGLAIYISGSSGGVAGRFQIYDYTNAVALANGLFMSQNGAGSNGQNANSPMKAVITPTSDIQVGIRLLDHYGPNGPSIVGNAAITGVQSAPNASYFLVKQMGSSAIVNSWTLSGSNTYNTTGNVGIGTNSPAYTLDVNGTAKLVTTPAITTATSVLVKDPTTSQISEQPISFITGVAKFIRNTSQSSIAASTTLILNTTIANTISNYVSLNTGTGVITLQPGTYELNGSLGSGTPSNGGDSRAYSLFHNGTAYVGSGGVTESGPAGNYNSMPQNNANHILTVAAGQTATISLKAQTVNNMSTISDTGDYGATADAGRAWVIVRKYN